MSLGKSIILLTVSPVSDLKRANTVLASGSDIFERIDHLGRKKVIKIKNKALNNVEVQTGAHSFTFN